LQFSQAAIFAKSTENPQATLATELSAARKSAAAGELA
jgi:hypothetical protein